MSWFDEFLDLPLAAIGGTLFAAMFLASELGLWIGKWSRGKQGLIGDSSVPIGGLLASILGLLAFVLSLSLSMAESRYENRRE